jgi:hypothetical protein
MAISFNLLPDKTTPSLFQPAEFNAIVNALTASVAAYPMANIPTPASLGLFPNKSAGQKMTSGEYNAIVTILTGVRDAANGGGTTTPPASTLAITSIDPSSAKAGDTIIVTGTGFTGALNVLFAGVAVGSGKFSVLSDTQITVTVPNVSAGSNPVQVVGASATSSARAFVVQAAAANVIPVATANTPAAITLPANQVALSGAGTDSDGTIDPNGYVWRQVTGPVSAVGVPANTASVLVSGLSTAGTYQFGFKVRDDKGAYSQEQFVNVIVKVAATTPAWDGRPMQSVPFGDSRTANQGFTGGDGEVSGWRTKYENLANQGGGAGYHNVRKDSGYPSQDSVFALSAVSSGGFFSSRRDPATYFKQIVPVWFAVNDKGQNPSRTVETVLENLRQTHQALQAMGFLTLAVTEPNSSVRDQYPDWFTQLNSAIRANAVANWGCEAIVDLDGKVEIANMSDPAISPDRLHFADLGNTYLAGYFLAVHNQVAAKYNVPTSATGGGGGKTTPGAPTVTQSGRTISAKASNGLADSLLRYTVKGGSEQTGASYTVPDASSVAAGEVKFYTAATGNYNQSPVASNTAAVAAVVMGAFYNPTFDADFAATPQEGMCRSSEFNAGSPSIVAEKRVVISNGAAHFNGQIYDGVEQMIKANGGVAAPIGTYKVTVIVTSKTGGGRWSLQNRQYDRGGALNLSINAPGTYTQTFTTKVEGEIIRFQAEDDGVIGDLDFFNVEPA